MSAWSGNDGNGSNWGGMVSDGTYMYFCGLHTISKINMFTGAIIDLNWATGFYDLGRLELSGTTLYVADAGANTIYTLDINDPSTKSVFFDNGLNYPIGLLINNGYLYVANHNSDYITKINLLNTADVTLIQDALIAGVFNMVIQDSIMYIAAQSSICTFNLNTSAFNTIATVNKTPGGISVYNDIIYVTGWDEPDANLSYVQTFSITGAELSLTWQVVPYADGIYLYGSNLYVANDNNGDIYKFSLAAPLVAWSTGYDGFNAGKLVSDGTYLYVDNNNKVAQTSLADGSIIDPALQSGYATIGGFAVAYNSLFFSDAGNGTLLSSDLPATQNSAYVQASGFSSPYALANIGSYVYTGAENMIGRVNLEYLPDINTEWLFIDTNVYGSLYGMCSYNNLLYVLTLSRIITIDPATQVITEIFIMPAGSEGQWDIVVYNDIIYATIYHIGDSSLHSIAKFQLDGTLIDLAWKTVPEAQSLALNGTDLYCTASPTEGTNVIYKFSLGAPPAPPALVCFKEGSTILTDKGYRPIQDLRKGDLVKTALHGYKAIEMIGKRDMYQLALTERIKDQLYCCSPENYPELSEDLVITGCHSILVDDFVSDEQREKTREVNGQLFVTDCKYRLPACADPKASVYQNKGHHTIYHIALEHEDYYMNYGVYANGLLVETCSRRYLKELSNMLLIA